MLSTQVPFLGICMGMQCAVIEYSRSKLGFADANSEEMNPKTSHPVVVFMPEITKDAMGGTMRLGARVRDWQRRYAVAISETSAAFMALFLRFAYCWRILGSGCVRCARSCLLTEVVVPRCVVAGYAGGAHGAWYNRPVAGASVVRRGWYGWDASISA